jgi:low affinity Fe/Cu permease
MCNNLPLYIYNEMSEKEKELFENHLAGCVQCRENLKTCAAVKNASHIQSAPLNAIENIFDKTVRKQPFFNFSKTWKLGFAAAACLMIAVFSVISDHTDYSGAYTSYDKVPVSYEDISNIDSELDEFERIFLA